MGFVAASVQVTFFISGGAFLKKIKNFAKKWGFLGRNGVKW